MLSFHKEKTVYEKINAKEYFQQMCYYLWLISKVLAPDVYMDDISDFYVIFSNIIFNNGIIKISNIYVRTTGSGPVSAPVARKCTHSNHYI